MVSVVLLDWTGYQAFKMLVMEWVFEVLITSVCCFFTHTAAAVGTPNGHGFGSM